MKNHILILILFISSIVFSQAITDTGNKVGIGTNTPADKLTIQSNSNNLRIQTLSEPSNYYAIINSNYNYDKAFSIDVKGGGTLNTILGYGDVSGLSLQPLGGFVGIGTPSPQSILHLVHKSYNSDQIFDPKTNLLIENTSNAWRTATGIRFQNFKGNFTIGMYGENDIQNNSFRIYNGENLSLTIKSNGNLGLGTSNPDSKLTVKGTIHTNEVKVDLLGAVAPDYVFHKDYDLKSLKDVEDYISINGHLPNIPSAMDMEINGILLKEMNLKLLEKIEELTLYAIEQETRMETLEAENKHYKSQEERISKLESEMALLHKN